MLKIATLDSKEVTSVHFDTYIYLRIQCWLTWTDTVETKLVFDIVHSHRLCEANDSSFGT